MIEEITAKEFDEFASSHELSSYHQSSNYASLMSKYGYERKYIALKDGNGNILGATLLLIKKIKRIFKYAYAPKGFLINYNSKLQVEDFTNKIKKYAEKNKIIFIKINPEIPTYIYDKNFNKKELKNNSIKNILIANGYTKLKDNMYFESMLPRFNGILDLKKYDIKKIDKTNRNKINSCIKKGLEIEITKENKIKELYPFIERQKRRRTINYYKNYFNIFSEDESSELFLVKINYSKYLEQSTVTYEEEIENNKKITEELFKNNNEKNYNKKMNSDKKLLRYKNDVINATYGINKDPNEYIAGAFCIKYKNHVHIIISGYNKIYSNLSPNYFLYNEIINYYKDKYKYLDLNGITGDFNNLSNPYRGLNNFKLGFRPYIYEFIGEFDLVINETKYELLLSLGLIQKEFKKD